MTTNNQSIEPTPPEKKYDGVWSYTVYSMGGYHLLTIFEGELEKLNGSFADAQSAKELATQICEAMNSIKPLQEIVQLLNKGNISRTCTNADQRTEILNLTQERDDYQNKLLNLLARIHRDGGHYIDKHGLEKACIDADNQVVNERSERDELKRCAVKNGEALFEAMKERDELKKRVGKLWKYATHLSYCAIVNVVGLAEIVEQGKPLPKCTCGLEELRKENGK